MQFVLMLLVILAAALEGKAVEKDLKETEITKPYPDKDDASTVLNSTSTNSSSPLTYMSNSLGEESSRFFTSSENTNAADSDNDDDDESPAEHVQSDFSIINNGSNVAVTTEAGILFTSPATSVKESQTTTENGNVDVEESSTDIDDHVTQVINNQVKPTFVDRSSSSGESSLQEESDIKVDASLGGTNKFDLEQTQAEDNSDQAKEMDDDDDDSNENESITQSSFSDVDSENEARTPLHNQKNPNVFHQGSHFGISSPLFPTFPIFGNIQNQLGSQVSSSSASSSGMGGQKPSSSWSTQSSSVNVGKPGASGITISSSSVDGQKPITVVMTYNPATGQVESQQTVGGDKPVTIGANAGQQTASGISVSSSSISGQKPTTIVTVYNPITGKIQTQIKSSSRCENHSSAGPEPIFFSNCNGNMEDVNTSPSEVSKSTEPFVSSSSMEKTDRIAKVQLSSANNTLTEEGPAFDLTSEMQNQSTIRDSENQQSFANSDNIATTTDFKSKEATDNLSMEGPYPAADFEKAFATTTNCNATSATLLKINDSDGGGGSEDMDTIFSVDKILKDITNEADNSSVMTKETNISINKDSSQPADNEGASEKVAVNNNTESSPQKNVGLEISTLPIPFESKLPNSDVSISRTTWNGYPATTFTTRIPSLGAVTQVQYVAYSTYISSIPEPLTAAMSGAAYQPTNGIPYPYMAPTYPTIVASRNDPVFGYYP